MQSSEEEDDTHMKIKQKEKKGACVALPSIYGTVNPSLNTGLEKRT